MKLTSGNGSSVTLSVAAYQFGPAGNWYDSNWLVISGEAADLEGGWSFRDPCLLTTEAKALGGWIRRAADASLPVSRLDFIEPNLWFERISVDAERALIRVGFDLEARPRRAADNDDFFVDLSVRVEACVEASSDWLQELEKFPERS